MSLTRNIDSYRDVEDVFQVAKMNPNGCSVNMGDNKTAQRWRMRAYHFRKLWADVYSESNKHSAQPDVRQLGYDHKSPWDHFVLQVDGSYVIIKPEEMKILEIIPADGIMPDDRMTATEVLDTFSGPAAPQVKVIRGISQEVRQDEDGKFSTDKPFTFE